MFWSWIFKIRAKWCNVDFTGRESRYIYSAYSAIYYIPLILSSLLCSILYPTPYSDDLRIVEFFLDFVIIAIPLWSIYAKYSFIMAQQNVNKNRAVVMFGMLPFLLYFTMFGLAFIYGLYTQI